MVRKNIADILPEPPDGTRLVLEDKYGILHAAWRDDAQSLVERHPDEPWFIDGDCLGWREAVEFARVAYPVGAEPLAKLV